MTTAAQRLRAMADQREKDCKRSGDGYLDPYDQGAIDVLREEADALDALGEGELATLERAVVDAVSRVRERGGYLNTGSIDEAYDALRAAREKAGAR